MTVSNFNAPSLTGDYGNILQQLDQSAQLALKTPSPLTPITQTVGAVKDRMDTLDDQKFKINQEYLQHSFDTELQRQRQDFEKRGEHVIDDDTINKAKDEFGVDISSYKGISIKPEDLQKAITDKMKILHNKNIQSIMNDPSLSMEEKRTKVLGEAMAAGETSGVTGAAAKGAFGVSKPGESKIGVDPTSSTGYRYFSAPSQEGGPWMPGPESGPPGSGKGGGSKPKPVSDKERDKAAVLNGLSDSFQLALDNYDPNFVGPVDSRVAKLRQFTGTATSKLAGFQSGVAGLQNARLHELYGARLTGTQVGRYSLEGPDSTRNEKDFITKMVKQAKNVNQDIDAREKSLREGGFVGIPEYKRIEIPDWALKVVGDSETKKQTAPPPAFNSESDAEAFASTHDLPDRTPVIIGGKPKIWRTGG